MQLTRFTLDAAVLATGSIPRHTSGIALILSAPGPVRSRGRALDPRTMAPGRMLGQKVHFLAASAVDMMVVEADHTLSEGSLRGQAIVALQLILARGNIFAQEARNRLLECVLQILLGDLAADLGSTLPISAPTRRRVERAARRSAAAPRALRTGVTDVATDLGLFHFGHFSTDYRAMFAETPSATLRDARARPG